MKKRPEATTDSGELRRRAEAHAAAQPQDSVSGLDAQKLLHELQVHQIELEMQNEALQQARMETENLLERYTELYDYAPGGYFTLDADGAILQVNLAGAALLGVERAGLTGRRLGLFVADRDRRPFSDFLNRVFARMLMESCDVTLAGEVPRIVRVDAIADSLGKNCRVTMIDITDQQQARETIWRQANYDDLTGLPNRRMFLDRLALGIKNADREESSLALLSLDLDHFKEVNDTLGHDLGDILLIEVARRIVECVRKSDTVARLSGDEFAIVLHSVSAAARIEHVAQNILDKLARPFPLGEKIAYVSASIGITLYPGDAYAIEELLKYADQAMYVAKTAGRNRYSYFTHALQLAAETRSRLINDLRGALDGDQLRVYYQPIVDLATGAVHKAEALLRWQHPQRGLVSPDEFIPLVEETGMIIEIGDWVFREVVRQAKRLRQTHQPDFQISVNVSPVQFYRDDSKSLEAWIEHLREQTLPGQGLVVEITEGLLLDARSQVTDKLHAFHDAGIEVSLDDFGTGYSALSYLKKFDIDYLKIDQAFVRNMENDAKDIALCEAIIVMAHKLGIKVIAEGVETIGQRDWLAAVGCDYAQGYLFSMPVPMDQFEEVLSALAAIQPRVQN